MPRSGDTEQQTNDRPSSPPALRCVRSAMQAKRRRAERPNRHCLVVLIGGCWTWPWLGIIHHAMACPFILCTGDQSTTRVVTILWRPCLATALLPVARSCHVTSCLISLTTWISNFKLQTRNQMSPFTVQRGAKQAQKREEQGHTGLMSGIFFGIFSGRMSMWDRMSHLAGVPPTSKPQGQ